MAAAMLMQMSATLKTGKFGSMKKSTTCPRRKPGCRTSRSVRFPATPPSRNPSAIAQPVLPRRRATHSTTTVATIATTDRISVWPVRKLNAAPEL